MTAGVFATVALSSLTGSWQLGLAAGCLFGLVRGLGVLVGSSATSPASLRHLLSRLDALDKPLRLVVAGTLGLASLVLALCASPWMGVAVVLLGLVGLGATRAQRLRPLR
jgi:hypothetical protein